jgi:hypothetical protein
MGGQNLLSFYILYNESKHNIVALVCKAKKTLKEFGELFFFGDVEGGLRYM